MINIIFSIFLISGMTGKIQGTVKNETTGAPVSYADVIILDSEMGAATDDNGAFFILNIPPGRYAVEISCIGFRTKRVENINVEIDQTYRLAADLTPTAIDLQPVTVTGQTPSVKKDMVGSTYIIRKVDIANQPLDYFTNIIAFQPAVANVDTALHVRGGRATEVQYLIDNVPIIDPQTGDPAIYIAKGVIDEVIFMPGGFDVEYGRAMSGVINVITEYPRDRLSGRVYGKTETIMPYYYDFGYQDYQVSLHLPVNRRFKGLFAGDLMHTDDWDPKLFILPHKQRDDYALYGKWLWAPSGNLRMTASAARSRSQFDRYYSDQKHFYKFYLSHYRSDWRSSDLEAFNLTFLPDSRKFFNLTLSRLYSDRKYGVRQDSAARFFEDFFFRDYHTLTYPRESNRNPFGARMMGVITEGDYPEYQQKESEIQRANVGAVVQVQTHHELKAGAEYVRQIFDNLTYFVSDTIHSLTDQYHHEPLEINAYIQDNIDYRGFFAKLGLRYDYFGSAIDSIVSHGIFSPRLGVSFLVTDKFLFRANVGRYCQPPIYDCMYGYYSLLPFPSYLYKYIPLVGNPRLGPEQTISYEIGLQGEMRQGLNSTFNAFYKDISNLVGTRYIAALPRGYVVYQNVEFGNVKGLESILEFANHVFKGKISYTLSWAKGTSSYASEVYQRYYKNLDTLSLDTTFVPPAVEYNLDFDQRNRIFVQGTLLLPMEFSITVFGYIGNGFPYTPPGEEGKTEERNTLRMTFRRDLDCVITKAVRIGHTSFSANFEIINLLDTRYQIAQHYPAYDPDAIKPWDFNNYYSCQDPWYHPAADLNHDGFVTPYEDYTAFRMLNLATDDWVTGNSAPRRARISIAFNF
jgi:outer membrane cobalamin receptor